MDQVKSSSSILRWFSLAPQSAPVNSRSTSTLLIQPRAKAPTTPSALGLGNLSNSSTASKPSELLAFQVYGVGDSTAGICPDAWANLPQQLKNLLTEAERLGEIEEMKAYQSINIDDVMDLDGEEDVKSQILRLSEA